MAAQAPKLVLATFKHLQATHPQTLQLKKIEGRYYVHENTSKWNKDTKKTEKISHHFGTIQTDGEFHPKGTKRRAKTPPPTPIPLQGLEFAELAAHLIDGTLTAADVFNVLKHAGKKPVSLPQLQAIGIEFDLPQKKLTLHLLPKEYIWKMVPPPAPHAKKPSSARERKKGKGSSPSKAKQK